MRKDRPTAARTLIGSMLLCTCFAPQLAAGQEVTVSLTSGRTFTAAVDPRSDEEQLVLRFEGVSTKLWRPIDWNRIESAKMNGQPLTIAELREFARQATPGDEPRRELPAEPLDHGKSYAEQASRALSSAPRVRTVSGDAAAANWDNDVEVDGIELYVYPISADGQVVPVDATVSVELIARRPRAARGRYVHSRGEPFPVVGRWTEQIAADQFGSQGAVLRLPFQALHPSFDTGLDAHGLVHLRLTVPGQGVFETSLDLIRIRPYSPMRDYLEQLEGKRFFPNESLGRTR